MDFENTFGIHFLCYHQYEIFKQNCFEIAIHKENLRPTDIEKITRQVLGLGADYILCETDDQFLEFNSKLEDFNKRIQKLLRFNC